MSKKKSLFVTFEGIEGSGKSYQSKKLYKKIKAMNYPVVYSREPGGTRSAEIIRKIILSGAKNKFSKITDTLLYLSARNEHIEKKLKPAILKKKIIICDRYIDSTEAYQVYGEGVNKSLVNSIHKEILNNIKPDITFILKLKISKAFKRMNKRKNKNRYDKFSKTFYEKVQKAFIKIANKNKRKYVILDTTKDSVETEKIIFRKIIKLLNK